MSYYIHNINPVILHIGGPAAIRWYGISYLLSFVAAILLLRFWAKKDQFQVPAGEVSNFIVLLAFFGVFLGGRVGYMLLYDFGILLQNPFRIIEVWKGGMASHGGMIGVFVFMWWYAKKHDHSFWNLADNMAAIAPVGFAFGRLANFVNGELWGRVTDVKWAVIFPQVQNIQYGQYSTAVIEQMVEAGQLQPRHPSQLYQSFTEGFLVFGIMLLLRRTAWGKREGALSACFLILYALARIAMEFFREPDIGQAVFFGWLTKGQLFSLFMVIGAGIILWRKKLCQKAS